MPCGKCSEALFEVLVELVLVDKHIHLFFLVVKHHHLASIALNLNDDTELWLTIDVCPNVFVDFEDHGV